MVTAAARPCRRRSVPGCTRCRWPFTAPATFFGAVGQAAEQLWSFLPIYLGAIILLLTMPWVLQKMVMISKQENITSIADFIAARYGKSQSLAIVVALICLVGVLPTSPCSSRASCSASIC